MRNAGGNLRLRKSEDLFQNFVLRGGLFISVDPQVASRIPLPALRATLSPGEGIGKAEISCAIVRFSAVYQEIATSGFALLAMTW